MNYNSNHCESQQMLFPKHGLIEALGYYYERPAINTIDANLLIDSINSELKVKVYLVYLLIQLCFSSILRATIVAIVTNIEFIYQLDQLSRYRKTSSH